MASFVTEVLAHSGSLEKEDLGTRISRLTRRVEEIKVRAAPGGCRWGDPGAEPTERTLSWRLRSAGASWSTAAERLETKAWDCNEGVPRLFSVGEGD